MTIPERLFFSLDSISPPPPVSHLHLLFFVRYTMSEELCVQSANDTDIYFTSIVDNVNSMFLGLEGQDYEDLTQDLLLAAMVKLQMQLGSLMGMAFLNQKKPLNEKKLEAVGKILSDIIFYVVAISRLREIDLSEVTLQTLTEATEMLDPTYLHDRFLCVNNMILVTCDMMELLYNSPEDGAAEDEASGAQALEQAMQQLVALSGSGLSPDEDEDENENSNPFEDINEEDQCIIELLTCVVIQIAQYDLDLDSIFYNATLVKRID